MIYITGDTHGVITRFRYKHLTENDFLIVTGDFGFIWDNSKEQEFNLAVIANKKFTTLFVDGNHENFELLNKYPVVEYCGGKAHKIAENIYHLMRGEVFTIDGKKFFAFGGASSTDRENRINRISWWQEELPNYQDVDNAYANLEKHNWEVDYVITHTAPEYVVAALLNGEKMFSNRISDPAARMLSVIESMISYKHWYFGHFHVDIFNVIPHFTCLYGVTQQLD